MAQFKDVFSTTLKVLLALVLISAALGIGVLFLGGVIAGLGSKSAPVSTSTAKSDNDARADEADSIRTTMPKSLWDAGMARAIAHHCYTDGMSEEEVAQALGEPASKADYGIRGASWTWQLPSGKCLRYDGDKCIQHETREKIIFFTAKGNVNLDGAACQTLNDLYVYLERSQLFVKSAKTEPARSTYYGVLRGDRCSRLPEGTAGCKDGKTVITEGGDPCSRLPADANGCKDGKSVPSD